MTEIVKKRRRWPRLVLAVLVLLIGGQIAWRFRPLNEHERQVLGKYEVEAPPDGHPGTAELRWVIYFLELKENRRYVLLDELVLPSFEEQGSWDANRSTLTLRPDIAPMVRSPWHLRLRRYVEAILHPPKTVLLREDDELYEAASERVRYRRVPATAR